MNTFQTMFISNSIQMNLRISIIIVQKYSKAFSFVFFVSRSRV